MTNVVVGRWLEHRSPPRSLTLALPLTVVFCAIGPVSTLSPLVHLRLCTSTPLPLPLPLRYGPRTSNSGPPRQTRRTLA